MNHVGVMQHSETAPVVPTPQALDIGTLMQGVLEAVAPIKTSEGLDERLRIHEYERQRLGQELHDSAGQLLVSLQLSIAHLAATREAAEHDRVIDEIRETVGEIDREIRSLAFLHYQPDVSSPASRP